MYFYPWVHSLPKKRSSLTHASRSICSKLSKKKKNFALSVFFRYSGCWIIFKPRPKHEVILNRETLHPCLIANWSLRCSIPRSLIAIGNRNSWETSADEIWEWAERKDGGVSASGESAHETCNRKFVWNQISLFSIKKSFSGRFRSAFIMKQKP